jgi:hypothetical protein
LRFDSFKPSTSTSSCIQAKCHHLRQHIVSCRETAKSPTGDTEYMSTTCQRAFDITSHTQIYTLLMQERVPIPQHYAPDTKPAPGSNPQTRQPEPDPSSGPKEAKNKVWRMYSNADTDRQERDAVPRTWMTSTPTVPTAVSPSPSGSRCIVTGFSTTTPKRRKMA